MGDVWPIPKYKSDKVKVESLRGEREVGGRRSLGLGRVGWDNRQVKAESLVPWLTCREKAVCPKPRVWEG